MPQLYFHGEAIPIKIKIKNESNKTVKKIKITGGYLYSLKYCNKSWKCYKEITFFYIFLPATVDQTTDIVLYSADKYTKCVLNQEFGYVGRKLKAQQMSQKQIENIKLGQSAYVFLFTLCRETVDSNGSFDKTLTITPLLTDNKEKRGLSLDGRLKDEDTNLASTTM